MNITFVLHGVDLAFTFFCQLKIERLFKNKKLTM